MLAFWKTRKARRAATGAIAPFVGQTRQRLGHIPDQTWSAPYVIGFIGTLITLYAEQDASALDSDDLAAVQTGAWSEITEADSILLGEDLCFLSSSGEATFELGCSNALSFFEALRILDMKRRESVFDTMGELPAAPDVNDETGALLWRRYFDDYLGRFSAPAVD